MSTTFYIATAWIVTFGALALYAFWVIRKGRELSSRVPEEHRRWM